MSVSISINKPPGYYMPGETIIGAVIADMDEPKSCENFTLKFEGKAEVEIVERHSHTSRDSSGRSHTTYHNEYYRANEIYFSSMIKLLGEATIGKGRTVFPFRYTLPSSNIPCSFTASHGSVNYTISAHIKRGLFRFDIREMLTFVVGPLLDLNTMPLDNFRQSLFHEETAVGGCCCCKGSELIKVQLTVPKRIFIPGEFIRFHMRIENQSKTKLQSGVMQFVLVTTCFAQGRSRGGENVYGQIAGPDVPKESVREWQVNNLWIPVIKPVGIPPSGLGGCTIISAEYGLRFRAMLDEDCCAGSVRSFVPLMVGTIALNA